MITPIDDVTGGTIWQAFGWAKVWKKEPFPVSTSRTLPTTCPPRLDPHSPQHIASRDVFQGWQKSGDPFFNALTHGRFDVLDIQWDNKGWSRMPYS